MSGRGKSRPRSGATGGKTELQLPTVNGWGLLAHPLFLVQLTDLVNKAEQEEGIGPFKKLLANVLSLMTEEIPANPGAAEFRHGGMLDGGGREWFRGKTGAGRYRLFYRFSTTSKLIVFAWINDEGTLRTRGSRTDAYAVFSRMVNSGNPPSDWDQLVTAASDPGNTQRFAGLSKRAAQAKSG